MSFSSPFDKWLSDKTHFWNYETNMWEVMETEEEEDDLDYSYPNYSELRVTFSRHLTWSERETFRRLVDDLDGEHYWENGLLFINANLDSRVLMKRIQKFVAAEYVNVHPRAVKTITPKVNV